MQIQVWEQLTMLQNDLWYSTIGSKYLSGNNLPLVSCSQTGIYSLLLFIDLICFGCSQSLWLSLDIWCVAIQGDIDCCVRHL